MRVLAVSNSGKYYGDLEGFISRLDGVEEAILVTSDTPGGNFSKIYRVGDVYGDLLARILGEVGEPDLVVGIHTRKVLEAVAYLAGARDMPIVTEVVGLEGMTVTRNILSGRGTAKYSLSPPAALTIAPGKFSGQLSLGPPEVMELGEKPSTVVVDRSEKSRTGVDIESAEIVVGVGRGFKEKDDLKLAFELAEALGGEVGCSRPIAADYKWLDEDRWIGISGKKLRGKLYIAVGISGAPQHIMAANDVKVIVAINKDKNAPIFEYADYGIVGDLYQILPILTRKVRELRGV